MNKGPTITIITPTVGRASLVDLIHQTRRQTYKHLEHIIVPDTWGYNDFGHSVRWAAADFVTTDYVMYLDDDDHFESDESVEYIARYIIEQGYPTFLQFPCNRFGEYFNGDPRKGKDITSIQYVHRRLAPDGQLIRFGDGVDRASYRADNEWIKKMADKYDYVIMDGPELVRVTVSSEGK